MNRTAAAILSAAALSASMMIAIPALVKASAPAPGQKADLADTTDCELRSWPYYERACIRDGSRNAGGRAATVRIIAPDRVSANSDASVPGLRTRFADVPSATHGVADSHTSSGFPVSYADARIAFDQPSSGRSTSR